MKGSSHLTRPGIKPPTRRKLDRICKRKRWTLTACIDVLVDYYLEHAMGERAPAGEPPPVAEKVERKSA